MKRQKRELEPIQPGNDLWMQRNGYRQPYLEKDTEYMQKGILRQSQLDSLYKIGIQVKSEIEALKILKRE